MTDSKKADKRRIREIDRTSPIRTLLNCLTLESIRDATYLLDPNRNIKIGTHSTCYEDILKTKKSTSEIIDRLLEVEASTPFKHCLVAKCTEPAQILQLKGLIGQSLEGSEYHFVVRFFREHNDHVFVTLDHTVVVSDWIDSEDGSVRKRDDYETRHSIVIRLSKSSGLITFSYPGFTQGSGTKRKDLIAYSDLLGSALQALDGVGISLASEPIKDSLKLLMSGPNRRVHKIRSDFEAVNVGRFDLSSLSEKKTIEEALADLLVPHMTPQASRNEFIALAKQAINQAEANFMILYWAEEAVITRLRFWDIGCEMLFTWHGERPSYAAIDSILGLILEAKKKLDVGSGSPLEWLSQLEPNELITPARMAEKFGLSQQGARRELMYAVKAGMILPIYRLSTNVVIDDLINDWTDDPSALRRQWKTIDGIEIDGADPRNIEVAFRRIGEFGGSEK